MADDRPNHDEARDRRDARGSSENATCGIDDGTATSVIPDPQPGVPPRQIGDFRIVRKIGSGGMGIVYEAEQQNPQRPVALKVIAGGQFVDELRIRLFQREAQALARLKHPSIAAIYESGHTGGQALFRYGADSRLHARGIPERPRSPGWHDSLGAPVSSAPVPQDLRRCRLCPPTRGRSPCQSSPEESREGPGGGNSPGPIPPRTMPSRVGSGRSRTSIRCRSSSGWRCSWRTIEASMTPTSWNRFFADHRRVCAIRSQTDRNIWLQTPMRGALPWFPNRRTITTTIQLGEKDRAQGKSAGNAGSNPTGKRASQTHNRTIRNRTRRLEV